MDGCRNQGPFLGTLYIRCRCIIGIQKGTIILTTYFIIWNEYLSTTGRSPRVPGEVGLAKFPGHPLGQCGC